MKYYKLLIFLLAFIFIDMGLGQNLDRFGRQQETALEFPKYEKKKDLLDKSDRIDQIKPENLATIPIEKAVDPEKYIIGPGDQFGININTIEQLNFAVAVGPAGDILIPTVGVVNVNNKTLKNATKCIKNFILEEGYKTADVYVTLINVRYFKIHVAGAVTEPGFYMVTPLTRLDEIIKMALGFHPFAKEFAIEVTKNNQKTKEIVNYLKYLTKGNLENNPNFSDGDQIFVPFGDLEKEGVAIRGSIENAGYDIIQPNETLGNFINRRAGFMETVDLEAISITRDKKILAINLLNLYKTELKAGDIVDIFSEKGVSVNGFVQVPGSYKFFPGYTCADYVGLAGGNSLEGNVNRTVIKHLDGTIEKGPDVIIRRGDLIIVPRSISQWLVGQSSIFQLIASVTSIYMSYLAATK